LLAGKSNWITDSKTLKDNNGLKDFFNAITHLSEEEGELNQLQLAVFGVEQL